MRLRARFAATYAAIALTAGAVVALGTPILAAGVVDQTAGQGTPGPALTAGPSAPTGAPTAPPSSAGPGAASPLVGSPAPTVTPAPTPSPRPTPRPTPKPTPRPTHRWDWSPEPWMTQWPGMQGQADPGGVVLAVARVPAPSRPPAPAAESPQASASPQASGQPAGTATADDIARAITLRVAALAVVVAILAAIAGAVAADRLVRPLRRLESAAAAVSDGDLDRRSGLADRSDEVGDLARAFDRMADTLATSEATQRRFLQDAIHELRTPLTVIEATTSAIIDGVYEPEPRHLATIRSQARVLSRIIDELRTISLAEGRGLDLRPEPVEVASTLRRVAEGFRARSEEANIALEVDSPEALVVVADPERLRQMLGSLVDNAMRHTPAGGAITLAGSPQPGPAVRLHVRDTGTGVAAEDQPHVFERFYQADASRDRARGASGLGLAIVKAITEAMGGRVGVTSTPARGADFWIELPAA